MKTKSSKQLKRHKPAVALKDLKARKDAKGGANGGVWKTEMTRQVTIIQDL